MRLGVLVHFRGIQLENERKGILGHLCFWDRMSMERLPDYCPSQKRARVQGSSPCWGGI